MLRINKSLNLVIPLDTPDAPRMYAYSQPIANETFERFYLPIARAFDTIYTQGIARAGSVPVAMPMLKDAAQRVGIWELSPEAAKDMPADQVAAARMNTVKDGLLVEIRRLTFIYSLGKDGEYTPLMISDALRAKVIDDEDVREIENIVAFFTILYHMHQRGEREPILAGVLRIWDASIISSDFTGYLRSLQTSTKGGNTGEKEPGQQMSSVPS